MKDPQRDVSFPDSVVSMMRGDLGQSPGGWPKDIQDKVLKGDTPYTVRPGSLLEDADLAAERKTIEATLDRPVNEFEFASYMMYPKVFTDYAMALNTYGPVSTLPTPSYFYGLPTGNELFVDLEKGVTLVVRNLAVSEANEKGMVTVFFELNGQPRRILVPDRIHGVSAAAQRRKAEAGNDSQVGAPMPGVVSTVSVAAGQKVQAGDVLLSIEAMKMETAIHAERDAVVSEVLVKTGDQIDAKDLLVVYS